MGIQKTSEALKVLVKLSTKCMPGSKILQFLDEFLDIDISKSSPYLGIKKVGFTLKNQGMRKHLLETPGIWLKILLFLNKYHVGKM